MSTAQQFKGLGLALLLGVGAAGLSQGATTISEAFDVQVDPFPGSVYSDDWTVAYRATTTPDAAKAIVKVDQHGLSISRTVSSTQQASIFYTGAYRQLPVLSAAATFRHATYNSSGEVLDSTNVSWAGFYLGAATAEYTADAWFVGVNPTGPLRVNGPERGYIAIWQNPGSVNNLRDHLEPVAFVGLNSPLSPETDYRVELEVADQTQIITRVLSGSDVLGELVYTLKDEEVIDPNGYFGWRASYANSIVTTWVSDVEFTVVPEPGHIAAIAALMALGLAVGLRRRQK